MGKKNKQNGVNAMNKTVQEDVLSAMGSEQEAQPDEIQNTTEQTDNFSTTETNSEELVESVEQPQGTVVNSTTTEIIQPLQPLKVAPRAGKDINTLKVYLEDYITQYTNHQVRDVSDKADAVKSIVLFNNIVTFILRYPEMELFERVVEFFREERSRVLNPKVALRGIGTMNAQSQNRCSMFHSLLTDATSKEGLKQEKVNMSVLEVMFNHPEFIKLITTYMSKQV